MNFTDQLRCSHGRTGVAGVATFQCGRAGVSDPGYSSLIVGRLCQTPLLTDADAELVVPLVSDWAWV